MDAHITELVRPVSRASDDPVIPNKDATDGDLTGRQCLFGLSAVRLLSEPPKCLL